MAGRWEHGHYIRRRRPTPCCGVVSQTGLQVFFGASLAREDSPGMNKMSMLHFMSSLNVLSRELSHSLHLMLATPPTLRSAGTLRFSETSFSRMKSMFRSLALATVVFAIAVAQQPLQAKSDAEQVAVSVGR